MSDEKKPAIDLETMQLVASLLRAAPAVKTPDSFQDFTGGLRQNWVFVLAFVAVFMWLNTQLTTSTSINERQDGAIAANAAAIESLTNVVDTYTTAQNTNNNDIIRRLDNLQKDVDILKGVK